LNIVVFFHGFTKAGRLKRKDHAQDCEMLIASRDQHPAILPWSLNFGWRPSFRVVKGTLPPPSGRIAAGRTVLERDLFGKPVSSFPDRALAHDRLSKSKVRILRKIMQIRAPTGARENW
jgi:hypothetical protein